jgi:hypothetical protein
METSLNLNGQQIVRAPMQLDNNTLIKNTKLTKNGVWNLKEVPNN